jgi:hypothetical protein
MKRLFPFVLVLLVALIFATPAFAQTETPPPMPNVNDIFPLVASLIGWPAFLAALINTAKAWFDLPDGLAPKITLYATLVVFAGCGVALFTGHLDVVQAIDLQLGYAAAFLLTFSAFVAELGLTKGFHLMLRGTPVIGKSYSYDKEQALIAKRK